MGEHNNGGGLRVKEPSRSYSAAKEATRVERRRQAGLVHTTQLHLTEQMYEEASWIAANERINRTTLYTTLVAEALAARRQARNERTAEVRELAAATLVEQLMVPTDPFVPSGGQLDERQREILEAITRDGDEDVRIEPREEDE